MLAPPLSPLWVPGQLPLVRIPFPGLQTRLERIYPLLDQVAREFRALSDEEQDKCGFWNSSVADYRKEKDVGIFDRGRVKGKDQKVHFHIDPDLYDKRLPIGLTTWPALLHEAKLLYDESLVVALEQVELLAAYLQVPGLVAEVQRSLHKLRLLWYYGTEPVLADRHQDFTFLTLHLGDTHPGFRAGERDELFETDPDVTLMFPGRKAPAASLGRLNPPLNHHVEVDCLPPGAHRMAIAFFLHGDWPLCD